MVLLCWDLFRLFTVWHKGESCLVPPAVLGERRCCDWTLRLKRQHYTCSKNLSRWQVTTQTSHRGEKTEVNDQIQWSRSYESDSGGLRKTLLTLAHRPSSSRSVLCLTLTPHWWTHCTWFPFSEPNGSRKERLVVTVVCDAPQFLRKW